MCCAAGRTNSVASVANPSTITLLTVPIPGRWRSGSHSRRTAAPTRMMMTPSDRPVTLLSP